jgi:ribose 5-phosphate isomerase B
MKIYLGADHAGFGLKEEIRRFLVEEGHTVNDLGANREIPDDDYPDYMQLVAEHIAKEEDTFGILFGGSGQGEAMVANRITGARAAVWYGKNDKIVTLSREHNNANILSIGARFVSTEEAKHAITLWLETPFSYDPRHERRIDKIDKI